MSNVDPAAWCGGDPERPYRPHLYTPEPVRHRRIVTTKDETVIDEHGNETRIPVDERPPKTITRITTFGVEVVDAYPQHKEDR